MISRSLPRKILEGRKEDCGSRASAKSRGLRVDPYFVSKAIYFYHIYHSLPNAEGFGANYGMPRPDAHL
jgi:hypothetical protein